MAWAIFTFNHHPDSLNDTSFDGAIGPFATEEQAQYWLGRHPTEPLRDGRGKTREVGELEFPWGDAETVATAR